MSQRPRWGWLVVAVGVVLILVAVLGAVAEDRWCGSELCGALMRS